MPDFQFINLSTSSRLDRASRRKVRQNAMQVFSRQKKTILSSGDGSAQSIPGIPPNGFKFRSWHPRRYHSRRQTLSSPPKKAPLGGGSETAVAWNEGEDEEDGEAIMGREIQEGNGDDAVRMREPFPRPSSVLLRQCASEWSVVAKSNLQMLQPKHLSVDDLRIISRIHPSPDTAGQMDPFQAAAIPLNARMQELLHHYAIEVPQSIFPIKTFTHFAQSRNLAMAISDEALLHAIMSYATMHKTLYGNYSTAASPSQVIKFMQSDQKYLSHQLQAVHMVSSRLKHEGVSDALIATVLTLLWHQNWSGGWQDTSAHLKGLQNMINSRGGMTCIPWSLAIATIYTYSKHASLSMSPPIWPLFPPTFTLSQTLILTQSDVSPISLPPPLLALLGIHLAALMTEVHRQTAFVMHQRFRGGEMSPRHARVFEMWCAWIDYQLLSYQGGEGWGGYEGNGLWEGYGERNIPSSSLPGSESCIPSSDPSFLFSSSASSVIDAIASLSSSPVPGHSGAFIPPLDSASPNYSQEGLNSSTSHVTISETRNNTSTSVTTPIFPHDLSTFRTAVLRTLLLWNDSGIWQWPLSSTLVRTGTKHLCSLLQSIDLSPYRELCPELLLWILVVGGCASEEGGGSVISSFSENEGRVREEFEAQERDRNRIGRTNEDGDGLNSGGFGGYRSTEEGNENPTQAGDCVDWTPRSFFAYEIGLFVLRGKLWVVEDLKRMVGKLIWIEGSYGGVEKGIGGLWRDVMKSLGVEFVVRKVNLGEPASS